nr:MAG TPA: hypothetical protein [Caudoviricetes sp.]
MYQYYIQLISKFINLMESMTTRLRKIGLNHNVF